jgi:hypothetical protein
MVYSIALSALSAAAAPQTTLQKQNQYPRGGLDISHEATVIG